MASAQPKADYGSRLEGYVEVKDRILLFHEKYPDGRLVTNTVKVTTEADGLTRVWVEALAYRTADDPHPQPGWSWMVLPGTTPYTRGSELENTETSAWGRAIGSLGIGIDRGIASAQEVRAKAGSETAPADGEERLVPKGRMTFAGRVGRGQGRHSDLQPRQMPDGYLIGFRLQLEDGKAVPQVIATGALGAELFRHLEGFYGSEVQVSGDAFEVQQPGRRSYARLVADAIEGPFGVIPNPAAAPGGSGEVTEAESEAIWAELGVTAGTTG